MAKIRLKYVTTDIDRHGNVRYYFRKRGLAAKTRLPGLPGSKEFMAAYEALLCGDPVPAMAGEAPKVARVAETSLRWLFRGYLNSRVAKQLDDKTRTTRKYILDKIANEPIAPKNPITFGDGPFAELSTKAINRLLDRKADTPAAANSWRNTLMAVFKWAIKEELVDRNPVKDTEKMRTATDGFHTWTMEEVAQFEACHPVGSMARMAFALLLYTGQRRSDVVLFGPQHVKDGWLRFTQQKNRNVKPVRLELPVLPALAEIIASTPTNHLTFIVSSQGKGYAVESFGNKFREWCAAAGLPHCTPHGLRKAGATRAAENGATAKQLMSIFGWSDIKQAELYSRAADQKRLANDSMHLIVGRGG